MGCGGSKDTQTSSQGQPKKAEPAKTEPAKTEPAKAESKPEPAAETASPGADQSAASEHGDHDNIGHSKQNLVVVVDDEPAEASSKDLVSGPTDPKELSSPSVDTDQPAEGNPQNSELANTDETLGNPAEETNEQETSVDNCVEAKEETTPAAEEPKEAEEPAGEGDKPAEEQQPAAEETAAGGDAEAAPAEESSE